MSQIGSKEARFLAEIIYLSEHPEEIRSDEIKVKMMRAGAKVERLLKKDDEADALLKEARRKELIILSAKQRMKRAFS